MDGLGLYLLKECYCAVACVLVIVCFLATNKEYGKSIIKQFSFLCGVALLYIIVGEIETYMGQQSTYYGIRPVLSWICYIAGPAILLNIVEILLRAESAKIRWILTIPQTINVLAVSTCFFAPWCFYFTKENNLYHAGPLSIIPRIMPIVYLAIMIVASFSYVRKSKRECIIVIVGAVLILFSMINEMLRIIPYRFVEETIGITLLAYFMYFISITHIDEVKDINVSFAETEAKHTKKMLDQSIETLAYTIDAKDKYTKGHSSRVARYSRMIASLAGKSEEEIREIYLSALLHDIGKLSIKDEIINKPGRLTEDEYARIKLHPVYGANILEKMEMVPFLRNGAKYHHERYDGKGYPAGLKGEEIPEFARIIAVADAYDAMTSIRSYRSTMDQIVVKQEIWKGMGTQFDPLFAKYMISLIDADINYDMREKPDERDDFIVNDEVEEINWDRNEIKSIREVENTIREMDLSFLGAFVLLEEHWMNPKGSIKVENEQKAVEFVSTMREDGNYVWNAPVIILYTSGDGELLGKGYEELAVYMSGGYGWKSGTTLHEKMNFIRKKTVGDFWDNWIRRNKEGMKYTVSTRRESNLVYITIETELSILEGKVVLADKYKDNNKELYYVITGDTCIIDM